MRPTVLSAAACWAGWSLLLADRPWAARPPLVDRLDPYLPGSWSRPRRAPGRPTAMPFQSLVASLARAISTASERVTGQDLARRLERIHSTRSSSDVRTQQAVAALAAFTLGALGATAAGTSALTAVGVMLVLPALAVAAIEAHLTDASDRWQRRLLLELPTICEHLGMLLGAGHAPGAALDRIAQRGTGACAQDLRRVVQRSRQGLGDQAALAEWAAIAAVPAVDRLVGILALQHQTGDLGRLIAEEARTVRGQVRREVVATLQRRSQQVWIPVTVATLVPGMVFIAVPFVQALQIFAAS